MLRNKKITTLLAFLFVMNGLLPVFFIGCHNGGPDIVEITGQEIIIDKQGKYTLLGNKLTPLMDELQQDKTDLEKLLLLNDFLEQAVLHQHKRYIHSENAVDYIQWKKGIVSVRQLAAHFQCSQPFLEKKFNEQVG